MHNYRAPIPKLILYIFPTFPIPTMALNLPLLKLYDCISFTFNNIYEFVKGQGYIVLTFHLKTNKQSPPTVRKIWFWYTKGNNHKRAARKRLTGFCITDYPFKLTLIYTVIG